jgi:hypothetical protein
MVVRSVMVYCVGSNNKLQNKESKRKSPLLFSLNNFHSFHERIGPFNLKMFYSLTHMDDKMREDARVFYWFIKKRFCVLYLYEAPSILAKWLCYSLHSNFSSIRLN